LALVAVAHVHEEGARKWWRFDDETVTGGHALHSFIVRYPAVLLILTRLLLNLYITEGPAHS